MFSDVYFMGNFAVNDDYEVFSRVNTSVKTDTMI